MIEAISRYLSSTGCTQCLAQSWFSLVVKSPSRSAHSGYTLRLHWRNHARFCMGPSLDLAPPRWSFCCLSITALSRPDHSATFLHWSGHSFPWQGATMETTSSSAGWEGTTLCGDWKTCDLLSTPYNNISPQLPGHSRKQVTRRTICTRAI